jgi:hypothetical protein
MLHSAHASTCVAALVASTALAACNAPDTLAPSATASPDVTIAAKPVPSPFTFTDLGVPTGYTTSYGQDVNTQGIVVGFATSASTMTGWMYVNGNTRLLPPGGIATAAYAVANGNPYYIAGSFSPTGGNLPALWQVFGPSPGSPLALPTPGAGTAYGVNDLGEAVGTVLVPQGSSTLRRGIYWDVSHSGTTVDPPFAFTVSEGTDVDNAGYALFNASGSPTSPDRAFLKTPFAGALIALRPPADLSGYGTYAEAISEPVGNVIYIAGKVQLTPEQCFAARWTFDLSFGLATVDVRREATGSAWGVSDDGTYVGVQSVPGGSRAYAWTLANAAIELPLPHGVRFATAHGIDATSTYIAGWADVPGAGRHAMLWTEVGP